MKRPNEKKQDLLLDALSCIDEDILAKSLALREGGLTANTARDGGTAPAADRKSDPTTKPAGRVMPPLYDLSAPTQKPPRRNGGRIAAVIVAACLLLCIVPVSMWMVGSMSKNENAPVGDEQNNQCGDGNGLVEDSIPKEEFDAPVRDPEANDPEVEAPEESMTGHEEPITEAPTRDPYDDYIESIPEPETYFDPHELVWSPADGNSIADYTAQAHNGTHVELIAAGVSASVEDTMALQMVAQWLLSLYALDYGDHFPLFYESFVQEKFIKYAVDYGRSYTGAIDRIDSAAANLLPVDNVTLQLSLEENTLLAGEELEAYIATKPAYQTAMGFSPERITAVRRMRVSGGVEIDGFHPDTTDIWEETFYLYEYEGEWYLDETFMDDDLSLDLLGTGKADKGFYKMKTTEGRVVAVDDIYLYLDTGNAFRIDGATVRKQTDGGEWHDAVIYVGDTVSVTHYSFEMEGLTRSIDGVENEEWTLSTATEVNYNVRNG